MGLVTSVNSVAGKEIIKDLLGLADRCEKWICALKALRQTTLSLVLISHML
jgi:hypothetical protein